MATKLPADSRNYVNNTPTKGYDFEYSRNTQDIRDPFGTNPNEADNHNSMGGAPEIGPREGELWKCGQQAPSSFLASPWSAKNVSDSQGDRVYEIDVDSYGDYADPTQRFRVKIDNTPIDTDRDGPNSRGA